MLWLVALLALTANVQGRAVNISNTWMLPEEGFPVFYRYFRDRISWYEADAVCQFHHANLVTVDTTAQYDAVRAYMKELDITSAVWVGLIRSNPDGDFTWTDYRGLSSDGYWSSAPDAGAAPLCAAADPAADYRWEARACGGPMVASFICELPVPQWASGRQGCMVKSLPALTILYLPESAAVQLTADCGLAGVRKVECTGNVKRDDLLKELSCIDDTDETIITPTYELTTSTDMSSNQQTTQDEIELDDVTSTKQFSTTHGSDINKHITTEILMTTENVETTARIEYHTVVINPDIDTLAVDDDLTMKTSKLNTFNLESNDIPKLAEKENFITEEETNKEDEKMRQHKMLHDELARLGNTDNFERIFTQSSDHFIPPLVMAKSRMNDGMAVLSVHQKAQQIAEEHQNGNEMNNDTPKTVKSTQETKTETTTQNLVTDNVILTTTATPFVKSNKDKSYKDTKVIKFSPKKYNEKYYDPKSRKAADKIFKKRIEKVTEVNIPQLNHHSTQQSFVPNVSASTQKPIEAYDSPALELSVILKEPEVELKETKSTKNIAKPILFIAQTKYKNSEFDRTTPEAEASTDKNTDPSVTSIVQDLVSYDISSQNIRSSIDKVYQKSTPPTTGASTPVPTTRHEIISTPSKSFGTNAVANLIMTTALNIAAITEKIFESTPQTTNSNSVEEHSALLAIALTNNTMADPAHKSPIEHFDNLTSLFLDNVKPEEKIEEEHPVTVENTKTGEDSNKSRDENSALQATAPPLNISEAKSMDNIDKNDGDVVNITSMRISDETYTTQSRDDRTELPMHHNYFEEFANVTSMEESSEEPHNETLDALDPVTGINETEVIDDFQSPLLSGASEPLHRPTRSRRPNQNHVKKFNPFRILG